MNELNPPQSTAVQLPTGERRLSAVEFQQLASVPAAMEWCANIDKDRLEHLRGLEQQIQEDVNAPFAREDKRLWSVRRSTF
jgi:hypothetical protein